MVQTLYGRLLVVTMAFGLVMTAIGAFILLGYHEAYHVEAEQLVNWRLAQQYADARLLISDEPLTVDNFHLGIRKLAELNPDVDIYLLDSSGSLVAASVPAGQLARSRVSLDPVQAFLGNAARLPILGDNPRLTRGEDIFSVAPVDIRDCPARYLYVILNREQQNSAVSRLRRTYTVNQSLSLLIACGVLAIAATLVGVRAITKRLSVLKADMERFEATNLPQSGASQRPSSWGRGDDVERLAGMFGELAARVRSQMEALRDTDAARREMIANISHDLRTPLAALRANLETLALKEATMDPAARREHVATATRQCERLARLVSQLLELAKIDAGQVVPHPEPFNLTELIHDASQKLAVTAAASGVKIRIEQPAPVPLAIGDVGLIERVIDNLADNAIRHSPQGAAVVIRVSASSTGRVRLEVDDTGPGIPPERRTRIFDRFYRGDESRPADAAHTGLGLSIVKSLLDLHGVAICVDTAPGGGARFSFELPAA